MLHYTRVIQGIANYVDAEIVSKMAGSWRAWFVGGMASLIASRAEQIFLKYKDNALVTALGLVQGENINTQTIYTELMKQAHKGAATLSVPGVATITFGPADVEALYRYIQM